MIEKKQSSDLKANKEAPPPKEEIKDTSLFGGKQHLGRGEMREWLRKEDAWNVTKIPSSQRVGLEGKIFDRKKFGEFIDKKEVDRVYDRIKNYPEGSKKEFGIKSEGERFKTLNWLKKLKGK